MASIKTRVAGLEQAARATVRRQLTDAERAVRVVHILNHPESSPVYVPLRKFLNRALGRDVHQTQSDGGPLLASKLGN